MSRGNAEFPERLDFYVTREMRMQVIAISYLMKAKGKHAPASRNMLSLGITHYLKGLTAKEQREYDQILGNVRFQTNPESIHKNHHP